MSNKNVVPEAREALNRFKMEAANEDSAVRAEHEIITVFSG